MGMLKSISLENYKCFKEKTDIDIAPLTVLCGVNSSGKSSILKSLLMLKQSYENELPYNVMTFNGKWVDNGYFEDIIYHDNSTKIEEIENGEFKIATSFSLIDTSDDNGNNPVKRQDMFSFKDFKKLFFLVKGIDQFQITTTITVKKGVSSNSNGFNAFIENNKITSYRIDINLFANEDEIYLEYPCFIELNKKGNTEREYYLSFSSIPNYNRQTNKYFLDKVNNFKCKCYFSNMHLTNIFRDNMSPAMRNIKSNLLSIFQVSASQFDGINFIAPLRQQPERRYLLNGNVASVGISGENTPILLARDFEKKKVDVLPPINIGNGKIEFKIKKDTLENLVSYWMKYLDLGILSLSGKDGFVELNINQHNIVDVGFGVSQSLPIIVQGLYMDKDQTLLLEQPEIHLHPEMQLQMADFLIALAKNEKNVIVETHSDHFINRIIHRIMQNYEELNDIIKIYIVEKRENENYSTVRLKHIDKYKGTEKDKNKFFFTQYDSEITDIVDTGLSNMLENS